MISSIATMTITTAPSIKLSANHIPFPKKTTTANLPLLDTSATFLTVPGLAKGSNRPQSRSSRSRTRSSACSSRNASRARANCSNNSKSTRPPVPSLNIQFKESDARAQEIEIDLEQEWWRETSFIESPATQDYIGELVGSIEKVMDVLAAVDNIDLHASCQTLIATLDRLIESIYARYTNETWLESAPPPSLSQTIRRLKNWTKSVRPPRQKSFFDQAEVLSFATPDSPTKSISECGSARLKVFINKFEGIIQHIEDEFEAVDY